MSKRVLICGCGYVGTEAGRILAASGHEVYGLTRSGVRADGLRAAGIRPVIGDISHVSGLRQLQGPFDWIVNTVSSGHGGAEAYRTTYLEGARNLLLWLRGQPSARLIYTSSTGVYGQSSGEWVDEDSPAEPDGETGQILRETERTLLAGAESGLTEVTILRVSGIYGPGRGYLFRQFIRGEVSSATAPSHWMNMIHRDDVAAAICAALSHPAAGGILNVTDNEPVTGPEFMAWMESQLGAPRSQPEIPTAQAPAKRGPSNKRVSNRRIRERLGWAPAYPTFREGYASAIQAVRTGIDS